MTQKNTRKHKKTHSQALKSSSLAYGGFEGAKQDAETYFLKQTSMIINLGRFTQLRPFHAPIPGMKSFCLDPQQLEYQYQ